MCNIKKQKFLFRCNDCQMILSLELEDDEDIIKVNENLFDLECNCGGVSSVLRD